MIKPNQIAIFVIALALFSLLYANTPKKHCRKLMYIFLLTVAVFVAFTIVYGIAINLPFAHPFSGNRFVSFSVHFLTIDETFFALTHKSNSYAVDYTSPFRLRSYYFGLSLTALSLIFARLSARKHKGKTLFKKHP